MNPAPFPLRKVAKNMRLFESPSLEIGTLRAFHVSVDGCKPDALSVAPADAFCR